MQNGAKIILPAIYSVHSTRKTRELYSAEFGKLKEAVPSFAPENITAGFEEAAVSAFKHISREAVSVHGCWFHFSQAVIKRAKKIGLTTPYRDGSTVRKCIRALTSTAQRDRPRSSWSTSGLDLTILTARQLLMLHLKSLREVPIELQHPPRCESTDRGHSACVAHQ